MCNPGPNLDLLWSIQLRNIAVPLDYEDSRDITRPARSRVIGNERRPLSGTADWATGKPKVAGVIAATRRITDRCSLRGHDVESDGRARLFGMEGYGAVP